MTELTQNWSIGKQGHRHPSIPEHREHDKLMRSEYTEARMVWVLSKGWIIDKDLSNERLEPLMEQVVKYVGRDGELCEVYPRDGEAIAKVIGDNERIVYDGECDGLLRLDADENTVKWRPQYRDFYKYKVDVCLDKLDATEGWKVMLNIKRYMEYQFGEIGAGFVMWWFFSTGGQDTHSVKFGLYGNESVWRFDNFGKTLDEIDISFSYKGAVEKTDRKNKYFDGHQKYVKDSWRKSVNKHA